LPEGAIVETFIVRIYRKGNGNPDSISGLVEVVEKDKTQGFATKDELWSIINPGGKRAGQASGKYAPETE
jgi:hypothetical protein